jgi:hypothetical protein
MITHICQAFFLHFKIYQFLSIAIIKQLEAKFLVDFLCMSDIFLPDMQQRHGGCHPSGAMMRRYSDGQQSHF